MQYLVFAGATKFENRHFPPKNPMFWWWKHLEMLGYWWYKVVYPQKKWENYWYNGDLYDICDFAIAKLVNMCLGEFDGFGRIGIETRIFRAKFSGRYGLLGGSLYISISFSHLLPGMLPGMHIQVSVKLEKLEMHRKGGKLQHIPSGKLRVCYWKWPLKQMIYTHQSCDVPSFFCIYLPESPRPFSSPPWWMAGKLEFRRSLDDPTAFQCEAPSDNTWIVNHINIHQR